MDAEFECVFPFNIDNGELDGLTPQTCFVLGYELASLAYALECGDGTPFARHIHAANEERVRRLLAQSGREFRLEWMPDDGSETWLWLTVGPLQMESEEAGQP